LNSKFESRIVLAPNYLLMTLIRIFITRGVTTARADHDFLAL
jgi:hypothetical protein